VLSVDEKSGQGTRKDTRVAKGRLSRSVVPDVRCKPISKSLRQPRYKTKEVSRENGVHFKLALPIFDFGSILKPERRYGAY